MNKKFYLLIALTTPAALSCMELEETLPTFFAYAYTTLTDEVCGTNTEFKGIQDSRDIVNHIFNSRFAFSEFETLTQQTVAIIAVQRTEKNRLESLLKLRAKIASVLPKVHNRQTRQSLANHINRIDKVLARH